MYSNNKLTEALQEAGIERLRGEEGSDGSHEEASQGESVW